MDCDYCGLATGVPAVWEVTTGEPGDGMTRYVCGPHLWPAFGHVRQVGPVSLFRMSAGKSAAVGVWRVAA